MTVKALREWLKDIPDDAEIYLDIDDFIVNEHLHYPVAKLNSIIPGICGEYHFSGVAINNHSS